MRFEDAESACGEKENRVRNFDPMPFGRNIAFSSLHVVFREAAEDIERHHTSNNYIVENESHTNMTNEIRSSN